MFALSCITCNDGEHGHDALSGSSNSVILTSSQEASEHEHCADFCPPFCACSCCGSGSATSGNKSAIQPLTLAVSEIALSAFSYQPPFSNKHLSALLRPPISYLG